MKKKALAWILALTMTLSSVSPVFAADIEIFGDSAAEAQEEAPVEENSESQGKTAGQENGKPQDETVLDYVEPEAGENGALQEPVGIDEGGDVLSDEDTIFQDGTGSQDAELFGEPEETTEAELFTDENAGK